ncbi:MAG TPA: hypothetical protein VGA37_06400 [Gemmatimonadales bacterium]
MTTRRIGLVLAAALVLPLSAQAQFSRIRSGVLFESYKFDDGLIYNKVTEMTIPIGIDVALGRFATVTLSTGYATVDLKSADPSQLTNQSLSGLLDTQVRFGVNVVPGRLIALVTGTAPTGIKTVKRNELAILGALSSDLIGFASPTVGSGGSVGGGFAGAIPAGRFALGLGATYKLPLQYQPVVNDTDELKPGAEMRFRAGLEGPLARQTYLRVAGIFAIRSKDEVAAVAQPGVGNRMIGYLALSQGFGSAQLTLYGFDVYRAGPSVESTPVGAAILPKGNLIAAGARLALQLGRTTTIGPRFEFRYSAAAEDATATKLDRQGNSMRFGVDIRQALSQAFSLVVQGGAVTGNVVQGGSDVGFNGFRTSLFLELTP